MTMNADQAIRAELHSNHLLWPGKTKAEWAKDHREFVLTVLLPHIIRPRPSVEQVIRWAYEAGHELRSDGSSVVPDVTWPFCARIKDPGGVGHDWLHWLQRNGLADPRGHRWTRMESIHWYRDAMLDFKRPVRARVRWLGLVLGSWWDWYFGKPDKPAGTGHPPLTGILMQA